MAALIRADTAPKLVPRLVVLARPLWHKTRDLWPAGELRAVDVARTLQEYTVAAAPLRHSVAGPSLPGDRDEPCAGPVDLGWEGGWLVGRGASGSERIGRAEALKNPCVLFHLFADLSQISSIISSKRWPTAAAPS